MKIFDVSSRKVWNFGNFFIVTSSEETENVIDFKNE